MIRYLIKNNFKLMFRNKLAVACLLFGPLLTIALLSSAFESLMSSYEAPDEFSVGYRENSSIFADNMDTIKETAKEAGIDLCEYPEGDASELIEKNGLAAFVELGKDGYTVYKSSDHKTEGAITEYFLERVMSEGANAVIDTIVPDTEMKSSFGKTKIEFLPAIDSTDYYGIIYIVYFSSLGMICATGVLSSEKKNGIEAKYRVCSLSSFQLFLARLIPASAVIIVSTAVETAVTVLAYDIHWGAPLISAAVVSLLIIACASFGFMLYSISQNLVITVISLFTTLWVMGFIGGTFETYIFSNTPEALKNISPLYHANRSLVELSCMGHSDYVASTLIYSAAILAVCTLAAVSADMIRKRGRA